MKKRAGITILLAEDHEILRYGLGKLIVGEMDLRVVGETGNGSEAVELTRRLRPDVLVLDLVLPGLHGLEVIKQVRQESKSTRVLVLSSHGEDSMVREAMHNGAHGYLLKECGGGDFIDAVRTVSIGQRYLSESLTDRVLENLTGPDDGADMDIYETLTSRERLVLRLAAEGKSASVIGEELFISPRTAETHRSNLMRKLALGSQTELVLFAVRKGIISV